MHRRAVAGALLANLFVAGCRDDGSPPMRDDAMLADTERQPVEDEGDEDDAPGFIDPPSGRITIAVNRLADLILRVDGIDEGSTRLELDGISVGTLGEGDPIGRLSDEELRLHLRGAMIPGRHTLVLIGAAERSSEVEVILEPADAPQLAASVAAQPSVPGTHLRSLGAGSTARLVIADGNASPHPVLRVFDHRDGRWSTRPLFELVAEGLVLGNPVEEAAFAVAIGTPTLAWRMGYPGHAIAVWNEGTTVEHEITPALRFGAEALAIGDPLLVPGAVLGTLTRLADTETTRPGDHMLVSARIVDAALDSVPFEPTENIDRLGPLLDPAATEFEASVSLVARVASTRSPVFDVDATTGLPRPERGSQGPASKRLLDIRGPLVGLRGAFGSRTLVGLDTAGPVILQIDDGGLNGVVDASPAGERLPIGIPVTGALALGIVAGTTVVLVPYGEAAEVHAIVLAGETPSVQPLSGLQCDQIAMAATPLPPEVGIALACMRAGSVRFGQISALPQP